MILNSKKTLEPVVILLAGGVVFFTVIILICVKFFPNDGQTFQIFGGAFTGFIGALLGLMKGPKDNDSHVIPPGGATIEQRTQTIEKQTIAPKTDAEINLERDNG